jgi:hypothetical protein
VKEIMGADFFVMNEKNTTFGICKDDRTKKRWGKFIGEVYDEDDDIKREDTEMRFTTEMK